MAIKLFFLYHIVHHLRLAFLGERGPPSRSSPIEIKTDRVIFTTKG